MGRTAHASTNTVHRCAKPDCNGTVIRTEKQVRIGSHVYCSRACAGFSGGRDPVVYTEEQIQYLVTHSNDTTRKDLEKHFELTESGLKSLIRRLRGLGHTIGLYQTPKPVVSRPTSNRGAPKPRGENCKARIVPCEHMKKEMVGTGGFAHPDRIYTTRHVTPGKIKVRFKKNNTVISANDQGHVDRIIKNFSESLGEVYTIEDPENILGNNLEAVGITLI